MLRKQLSPCFTLQVRRQYKFDTEIMTKTKNPELQHQKSPKATKNYQTSHKFIARLRWNTNESRAIALVRKSACWNWDGTWMLDTSFLLTSSLKGCRTSMCFELELVMGFCASYTAPSLSSDTDVRGVLAVGNIKRQSCLRNRTSSMTSARATYSASVVDSVTQFCVLENHDTQAPPHITSPPELTSYQLPHSRSPRQQTPASSNLLLYLSEK